MESKGVSPCMYCARELCCRAQSPITSGAPSYGQQYPVFAWQVTQNYVADFASKRIDLTAQDGSIWALRFPGEAQFHGFVNQYNGHLFTNTHGKDNDAGNRDEVGGT
jgi:hypothetical protein